MRVEFNDEGWVVIPKEEYIDLLNGSDRLEALEGHGVEYWECYEEAVADLIKIKDIEKLDDNSGHIIYEGVGSI